MDTKNKEDLSENIGHLLADDFDDEFMENLESIDEIAVRHLKSWARFPKHGDIYEAQENIEVTHLTPWLSSFSGGSDVHLPRGTKIKVHVEANDKYPIRIHAFIFYNDLFEGQFIPEEIRRDGRYSGLVLNIGTEELNFHFRLLSH